MNFQREDFSEFFDDALPLLEAHYKEIAHYQDIELDIDVETYMAIDSSDALRMYSARDDDGVMSGYAVFFIRSNLHYQGSLQANQDVVYIDKEKRGFGRSFIKWCDEQLRFEGVQVVYHHVKADHNWGAMLEEQDYKLVDVIYAKRLDNGN